jgi:dTDP-4-amino-4,6-dideoxygalactose transaminase
MSFQQLFDFESALAEYTGAPYAVVTDSCTHAIELCMKYNKITECQFTAYTYLSVPLTLYRLGIRYQMIDEEWIGEYQFHNTCIWDSARRLERNMFKRGQMQCLSFGNSKPLQLGRVGAILLDDPTAYSTLSQLRSDGRDLRINPWINQSTILAGYHYCPTLELCQQGLNQLNSINESPKYVNYPDCRLIHIVDSI